MAVRKIGEFVWEVTTANGVVRRVYGEFSNRDEVIAFAVANGYGQ